MRTVPTGVESENSTRGRPPLPGMDGRTWLMGIPLALIVIAAFIPSLNNGFVNWDDDKNFLENPFYHGLGPAEVKWAWTTFWLGAYQPLAWLLYEAQFVIWRVAPHGYHLTSILLHSANAVVLYVLTVTLLARCQPDLCHQRRSTCALGAALATALFMVHPLRVEAVAWASGQPYLPCASFPCWRFSLISRRSRPGLDPRWGWLAATFVLFIAALLSHALAVSLPVVLVILDVYPLRRFGSGPGQWFGPAARSVAGEGPVDHREPDLHGPGRRGQAANLGLH